MNAHTTFQRPVETPRQQQQQQRLVSSFMLTPMRHMGTDNNVQKIILSDAEKDELAQRKIAEIIKIRGLQAMGQQQQL